MGIKIVARLKKLNSLIVKQKVAKAQTLNDLMKMELIESVFEKYTLQELEERLGINL